MRKPLVTVAIATFNSSKTINSTLSSILKQTYSRNRIEILIIDGGSTDDTKKIARKYNARIINNSKVEPVSAKFLAIQKAYGDYLIFLDHDESFVNKKSIEHRIEIFSTEREIKAILSTGYIDPPHTSIINTYINEFGDPFSFFIYRLSKNYRYFVNFLNNNYKKIKESDKYIIYDFRNGSTKLIIIELCALGSMLSMKWIKSQYKNTLRKEYIPHFFYQIISNNMNVAIMKSDRILHRSSDNFNNYSSKIRWRIKNNIFHTKGMAQAGYFGREKYHTYAAKIKKLLFIPYSLLIFPSLLDAIYLMITRKKASYIIHTLLCLYTAIMIIYFYLLKLIGVKFLLKSYDETIDAN